MEHRLLNALNRSAGFRITGGRLQVLEDDRPPAHLCPDTDDPHVDSRSSPGQSARRSGRDELTPPGSHSGAAGPVPSKTNPLQE